MKNKLAVVCLVLLTVVSCRKGEAVLRKGQPVGVPSGFDVICRVNPGFLDTKTFKLLDSYFKVNYNLLSYAQELFDEAGIQTGRINEFSFGVSVENGLEYLLIANMKKDNQINIDVFSNKTGLTIDGTGTYAGSFKGENIFVHYTKNRMFVANKKNIIADLANKHDVVTAFQLIEGLDIEFEKRLFKFLGIGDFDTGMRMINIKIKENQSSLNVKGIVPFEKKENLDGSYYVLSGLRDVKKGMAILAESDDFAEITNRTPLKKYIHLLRNVDVTKAGKKIVVDVTIDFMDIGNVLNVDMEQFADGRGERDNTGNQLLIYRNYRIKPGDMISNIAEKYGLNSDTIISVNNIKKTRPLTVNQVILIPNMDGILYTVKRNDTLESVSSKYGIDIYSIKETNDLDSDDISKGMKLFIPGARLNGLKDMKD